MSQEKGLPPDSEQIEILQARQMVVSGYLPNAPDILCQVSPFQGLRP